MRYYIYCRKSSEDEKRQVRSIPDQLDWAHALAKEKGFEIIKEFQDTKTARKPAAEVGRHGFLEMVDLIHKSSEPVGILCWKIDRLARNPIDEGIIKYAFMKDKIKHICACEREYKEGDSQILMGVDFGAATQYSIDLSRNVKRGLEGQREKGLYTHRVPFGYLNDKFAKMEGRTRVIAPDPERFKVMRELWDMLLSGAYSVRDICRHAKEKYQHIHGISPISPASLNRAFHNKFYTGIFEINGRSYSGTHTPMITLNEFERAQVILSGGVVSGTRHRKHEPLYRGLVKCAECGCSIVAETPKTKKQKNGKVRVYHYLQCSKMRPDVKCSQKCVRLENLESQIEEFLEKIRIHDDFHTWAIAELRRDAKVASRDESTVRAQLTRRYNEIEQKRDAMFDKMMSGTIDDETYREKKRQYDEERVRIKAEMDQAANKKDAWYDRAERFYDFAKLAADLFNNGKPEVKRLILASLPEEHSNLSLKDGELLPQAKYPFYLVGENSNPEKPSKVTFEPLENTIKKGLNVCSDLVNSVWLGRYRAIRTYLIANPTCDVPVIG